MSHAMGEAAACVALSDEIAQIQVYKCPFYPKVLVPFLSGSAFDVLLFSLERVKLQGNKNNLGQKLSSLLSSDGDCRKVEELANPQEILRMLIDLVSIWFNSSARVRLRGFTQPELTNGLLSFLLATQVNDKEEALAHQRKVSYMLARAAEAREAALGQDGGHTGGRCWFGAQGPPAPPHTDSHRLPAPSCAPALPRTGAALAGLRKSLSWPSALGDGREPSGAAEGLCEISL